MMAFTLSDILSFPCFTSSSPVQVQSLFSFTIRVDRFIRLSLTSTGLLASINSSTFSKSRSVLFVRASEIAFSTYFCTTDSTYAILLFISTQLFVITCLISFLSLSLIFGCQFQLSFSCLQLEQASVSFFMNFLIGSTLHSTFLSLGMMLSSKKQLLHMNPCFSVAISPNTTTSRVSQLSLLQFGCEHLTPRILSVTLFAKSAINLTIIMQSIDLGQLNENQEQFLDSLLDKAETVADKAETVANIATPKPPTPKMSETARIRLNHNKAQFYIQNTMNKVQKGIRRGRVRFSQSSIDLQPIIHPQIQEPVKTIDLEEHKQMVEKFRRDNRLKRKRMRQMSIELEKRAQQQEQNEMKSKSQLREGERLRRRQKAEERIKRLGELKKQRLGQLSASNRRLRQLSNTTLEDIYKHKFQEEFTLPAIREKDRRLQKIKKIMAPMDFQKMEEFKKSYLKQKHEMALNKRLMREMDMEDEEYKPPTFVPASYLIVQEEERQSKLKKIQTIERDIEIAKRKNEYVKFLMQNFREEARKNKSKKRKVKQQRSASTAPLTREQTKDKGNKYFDEIRQKIKKKLGSSREEESVAEPEEYKMTAEERRQYIEFNRKVRLEDEQRIRMTKISNIINDETRPKMERDILLKMQVQKLDRQLQKKEQLSRFRQESQLDAKDTANLVVASIQAKLALLDRNKNRGKAVSERTVRKYRGVYDAYH